MSLQSETSSKRESSADPDELCTGLPDGAAGGAHLFPGPKRSRVLVTFFAFPSAKNLIFHQSVTCHNVTS